ncbi:MAG: hypothetical protein CME55_07335 [Halieaceae bacterium]|nr:hypothetical protein [Halieaceae bacterium]
MTTQGGLRRCVRLLVWCFLLLTLTGCSATQFIYNRVDVLVRWHLDDYVSLDRDQRAQFDERLDILLEWHRREELPEYVLLLDDALAILDNGVPLDAARDMADRIELAAIRFQGPFLELLLRTGKDLRQKQRVEFVDAMMAKQEEFEADRLARSDEEYREDLEKRFDAQLSRYMGPLTPAQIDRIAAGVADMTRLDRFWLEDRRVWIEAVSDILLRAENDWPDQVRAMITGREDALLPAYREGIDHNGEVILQLSRDVLISRTEKQDRKLRSKLIVLRDDLAALAAQGASTLDEDPERVITPASG